MAVDTTDNYTASEMEEQMEEEPTQPATQQYTDPRRLGQENSGLDEEDLSDIYCILHPCSPVAYRATALIHQHTPQFTIHAARDVKIHQRSDDHDIENEDPAITALESQGLVSCDIALRLSAPVKNKFDGGFYFGRNSSRCDIVLGREDEVKRVSNIHFRIYINEYSVIMLEDQSTNGTVVDATLLRAKDKLRESRITLGHGSVISLTVTPHEEDFRFIVRIPQRDPDVQALFERNINYYLARRHDAHAARNERKAKDHNARNAAKGLPPDLFATPDIEMPKNPRMGRQVKEWRGGLKYNKLNIIGKGAFAVVWKITAKFDGVPFAAKELEKRTFMKNGVLDIKIDMEMKIMQKIQHPHIVQYIEHIDWEDRVFIVMEYVGFGDLGGLIAKSGRLEELKVKTVATQLLSALKYLHNNGITHRDVKPDNILIHSYDPFQVKLTDFGLSKMIDNGEITFMRTFCGTLLYCAPEVYSEYREYDDSGQRTLRGIDKKRLPPQRYSHAVDVWSLAGVLFYILTGVPPFPAQSGITPQELLNKIMTQALDVRPLQRADVSEQGLKFIKSMLHIRPQYRATVEELESDAWITGAPESFSMSMEDDEVDLVKTYDDNRMVDPELTIQDVEEGASQLSLRDIDATDIVDSDDEKNHSGLTELLNQNQREIKNSWDTNDTRSDDSESFGFIAGAHANTGKLFGEVSAVGSSGAIPSMLLPQPVPRQNRPMLVSESTDHYAVEPVYGYNEHGERQVMLNPIDSIQFAIPIETTPLKLATGADDRRAARSSSLMGAESLVGQLNMQSPSAGSPGSELVTEYATPTMEAPLAPTMSLRRPREDDDWQRLQIPPKKKLMSSRQIDLELPPKVFWDPKNKATHHTNYPPMSASNFHAYEEYAAQNGETFTHGARLFENTMQSFRASRSPSFEPVEIHGKIETERQALIRPDERKLSSATARDRQLPETAPGTPVIIDDTIVGINIPISTLQPVVGNDFQLPKRILAKVVGTSNSVLPNINLNVTESVTSWGRGENNTIIYSNGQEIRIPKYAFKILLYKPNFYKPDGSLPEGIIPGNGHAAMEDDMSFYISTKTRRGIKINGSVLQCFNQSPKEPSMQWAKIHHGDVITVWTHDPSNGEHTSFNFECFWGESKERRAWPLTLETVPAGPILEEIEIVCLAQENELRIKRNERIAKEKTIAAADRKKSMSKKTTTATTATASLQSIDGGVPIAQASNSISTPT